MEYNNFNTHTMVSSRELPRPEPPRLRRSRRNTVSGRRPPLPKKLFTQCQMCGIPRCLLNKNKICATCLIHPFQIGR